MSLIEKQFNDNTIFRRIDSDYVYILNLADVHIGSIYHNRAQLEKTVEMIKATPNLFVIIGGDITEHSTIGGASSVFEESAHGIDQIYIARDILFPIKDRILFIRSGNHGLSRALKYSKIPPEQVLASLLEIPFFSGIATAIINARKNCYVISSLHNTKKPNTLEWINSDVIFIEHLHQQNYECRLTMDVNKFTKKWVTRPIYFVYAGSFLSWGGYGAERGYRPVKNGCPVIELCGIKDRRNVYIYSDIDNFQRLVK